MFENTGGYNTEWVDWSFAVRLLRRENRDAGGSTFYRWQDGQAEKLFDTTHEDDIATSFAGLDRITKPLFIGHARTTSAARSRSHANRLSFLAMEEAFFAEHLGGACEPAGDDLAGSSMVDA